MATKSLPKTDNYSLPVINIAKASAAAVAEHARNVKEYGASDWMNLVADLIGAIHQIPAIYSKAMGQRIDLKHIQAYFGRSSAGPHGDGTNLKNRLYAGLKNRQHPYGIVLAQMEIDTTIYFEKFGISLLDKLRTRNGLCISNTSSVGQGGVSQHGPGYLYMTFSVEKPTESLAQQLTNNEIRVAVEEMLVQETNGHGPKVKRLWRDAGIRAFELSNDGTYKGVVRVKASKSIWPLP